MGTGVGLGERADRRPAFLLEREDPLCPFPSWPRGVGSRGAPASAQFLLPLPTQQPSVLWLAQGGPIHFPVLAEPDTRLSVSGEGSCCWTTSQLGAFSTSASDPLTPQDGPWDRDSPWPLSTQVQQCRLSRDRHVCRMSVVS